MPFIATKVAKFFSDKCIIRKYILYNNNNNNNDTMFNIIWK